MTPHFTVLDSSGLDTALDIPRELFAKNQILSAERTGRAQERDDQPHEVLGYSDDRSRQLQHAHIMPESARGCRRWTRKQPRRELLQTTDALPLPSTLAKALRTIASLSVQFSTEASVCVA